MRKMLLMLAVLTTCLAVSTASAWIPPDCTNEPNYCVR